MHANAHLFSGTVPAFVLSLPLKRTQFIVQPLSTQRPSHLSIPHRLAHKSTMVASLPLSPTVQPSVAGQNPVFAQCMLRVNNPTLSHKFYTAIGMKFMTRLDFKEYKFSLFFYAYTASPVPHPSDPQPQRAKWLWARPEPTIELTWNWTADTFEKSLQNVDKESPEEIYVNGNTEPLGFGYVGVSVTDVKAAVQALKASGIPVVQEPVSAGHQAIATIQDPDGYHIRLSGPMGCACGKPFAALDPVYSTVMLRIKDPRSAVKFFSCFGFKTLAKLDDKKKKSSEYYLACTTKTAPKGCDDEKARWLSALREPTIKLDHVWGTENAATQMYQNGNDKPHRGYGHVGVVMDDIYGFSRSMKAEGYTISMAPRPFQDVGDIAFLKEPSTAYAVEIIKRAGTAALTPYAQPKFC